MRWLSRPRLAPRPRAMRRVLAFARACPAASPRTPCSAAARARAWLPAVLRTPRARLVPRLERHKSGAHPGRGHSEPGLWSSHRSPIERTEFGAMIPRFPTGLFRSGEVKELFCCSPTPTSLSVSSFMRRDRRPRRHADRGSRSAVATSCKYGSRVGCGNDDF